MSVEERAIINKKGHTFKDTGAIDLKTSRDCLVFLANCNGASYYLTLATHNNDVLNVYNRYKDKNYLLSKKNCPELLHTSLVNLESIYKGEPNGRWIVTVPLYEFEKIIKKFKAWQESNPDEYYNEIKDNI